MLTGLSGFAVVAFWGPDGDSIALRRALAAREGVIIPLVTGHALADYCILERHICIDTTAAGGNTALLAG